MTMQDLVQRAADLGIEREYFDAHGVHRTVGDETLQRLVDALTGTAEQPAGASTLVWQQGRSERLAIPRANGTPPWRLFDEGETEVARGFLDRGELRLPASIAPGLYQLDIEGRDGFPLLVAPKQAYQLEQGAERMWVLAVQLYAVRSQRNWGHGDFTDLAALVGLAAAHGAAGVGLNPLHALFDDRPEHASPYSPNSRLFLNPLYIDLEAVHEFPGRSESGLADDIARLGHTDQVDYEVVGALKGKALRLCYERFRRTRRNTRRRKEFEAFRAERGATLSRFAAFEVLRRRFHDVWWNWPPAWRRPTEQQLASLRAEADAELTYFEYVQWLADAQLAACQAEARSLGMAVGLYIDLAVGVEPGGADAWSAQDNVVPQVEVGAPPDLLNTAGQAWGLAAFNPRALEAANYAPFAALLEAAMRHAGAIRLDHVLGLNRLFLIPFGLGAKDGAYVRYPLQGLLATTAMESVRHRCVVIGEDLGTVPDELRGVLADWGIWSYLVMMFERSEQARFKHPHEYRRNALVTFNTHDLPSFAGWMGGHDLAVKRGVGLDPGETDEEREDNRSLLREVMRECALGRAGDPPLGDVLRFLARTQSRMLVVALDDILGVLDQPNVPGTLHEHPNWRRRLPAVLEDIACDPRLAEVAAVLREEGRAK